MRKMILREPVITPKTKMAQQICTNQNPEPSKYIAWSSTLQCLGDGDEGFNQFTGERNCSDISAVTALGGAECYRQCLHREGWRKGTFHRDPAQPWRMESRAGMQNRERG